MSFSIFPLRAIIFQAMFLLLAIAAESHVFQRNLRFSPRKATQYAATLNLLTTSVGWTLFFSLEPFLSPGLQEQLLNYVLFDRWTVDTLSLFVGAGFLIFFANFLIKLLGFSQLELALMTPQEWAARQETSGRSLDRRRFSSRKAPTADMPQRASTILAANAFSHTAILLLLLTRIILTGNPLQ